MKYIYYLEDVHYDKTSYFDKNVCRQHVINLKNTDYDGKYNLFDDYFLNNERGLYDPHLIIDVFDYLKNGDKSIIKKYDVKDVIELFLHLDCDEDEIKKII